MLVGYANDAVWDGTCHIDVIWSACSRCCQVRHIDSVRGIHLRDVCPGNPTPRRALALAGQDMEHRRNLVARKDRDIRADVLAEMAWDPKVTIAEAGAIVKDGCVRLTGVASTYATKDAATAAALRAYGVKDVDNDIVVDPAAFELRTDEQIALDVRCLLALDSEVPDARITVSVHDGVVALAGDVDYHYQRGAAEDDAANIIGVHKVISNIAVLEAVGPRHRWPALQQRRVPTSKESIG